MPSQRGAAGHLRVGGRRLTAPRGVRPSQGLVREAIFDLVGARVVDAAVIDLFAGSGALGIEALSRGAARAPFVDRDEGAVRAIRRNLAELALAERGRVVRAEAGRWLQSSPDEVSSASLVLLDPPYEDPALDRALALLDELAPGGATIVVEHAFRRALPELPRLRRHRERRYGDSAVTVLVAP